MNESSPSEHGTRIVRTLTIAAEPEQILHAWCDVDVQRQILDGAAELLTGDGCHAVWRLRLPLDPHAEFTHSRVEARLGQSVRYAGRGEHGLQVESLLQVAPAPGTYGCEATLVVDHRVEGAIAQAIAKLAGPAPDMLAGKALRRLKAWLEAGEVPSLHRNPSGRQTRDQNA